MITQNKGLSVVVKGGVEGDGTYHIWASGSDDEEIRNPTHGMMYALFEEGGSKEENITRRCFVSTGADKSPMTLKVSSLLELFNIHVIISLFYLILMILFVTLMTC